MIAWLRDFILPVLAGTLVVLAGIAIFAGLVFTRNACSDDVVSEQVSPDGSKVVVEMEGNCGATSPYAYRLSLRYATHNFPKSWVGRITDGEVFTVPRVYVRADWIGNDQLQITCKDASRVRVRPASWQGFHLLYSDGVSSIPASGGK